MLNSLDDLIKLRRLRERIIAQHSRPRWAVIGGGLIGCEISADLTKAGDSVVLFHAMSRLMERQLTSGDSTDLLGVLRDTIGVEVLLDQEVLGFTGKDIDLIVNLSDKTMPDFHGIIVSCGFRPRIELALDAGLETHRGIIVNEYLCTTDPNVYVIGDTAEMANGKIYAYILPIRSQALWLAKHITGTEAQPWLVPFFKPKAKVPGFVAKQPYLF